jgi:hypothetical protein
MGVFRALLLLLLLAGAGCFVAYAITGEPKYRAWGLRFVKWAVAAGLLFFAVLIAMRLIEAD